MVRLTAQLAELPAVPPDAIDTNAVRASWKHLTDRERRMIIDRFVRVITIAKLKPGQARRKNVGRITIAGPGW